MRVCVYAENIIFRIVVSGSDLVVVRLREQFVSARFNPKQRLELVEDTLSRLCTAAAVRSIQRDTH